MIAHVAEASEGRGRVVVRLGDFACSSASAIAATIHVAQAFRSQIEGLFVENPDLHAACSLGVVREVALHGRKSQKLAASRLSQDAEHFAVAAQRQLADAASRSSVAFTARVIRDTAVGALQTACNQSGPWNIIVFAEPIASPEKSTLLCDVMAHVFGTTGTIASGRFSSWRKGPILVAVEDIERLNGMIRAAQQLAAVEGDDVLLMPIGLDEFALDWLESEIRLTLGEAHGVSVLARASHVGFADVLRADIAARKPRLVIARHGGILLPVDDQARPLAELGCPVFQVH